MKFGEHGQGVSFPHAQLLRAGQRNALVLRYEKTVRPPLSHVNPLQISPKHLATLGGDPERISPRALALPGRVLWTETLAVRRSSLRYGFDTPKRLEVPRSRGVIANRCKPLLREQLRMDRLRGFHR